jgi:hypothetical protein
METNIPSPSPTLSPSDVLLASSPEIQEESAFETIAQAQIQAMLNAAVALSTEPAAEAAGTLSTEPAAEAAGIDSDLKASDDTSLDDSCKCSTQWQLCVSGCKKRVIKHPRGVVCKVHHHFISCAGTCGNILHVGCVVEMISGRSMLPDPNIPWLCAKCTPVLTPVSMKVEVGVTSLPASSASKCTPDSNLAGVPQIGSEDAVDTVARDANIAEARSYKTKTFFEDRQALCHHMRMTKWTCYSGGEKPWLYFRCACLNKLGQPACSVKLAAIATDANELEHGEWSVKDLPTSHECVAANASKASTILTTHGKSLSREVLKDIQRLSCSKAFQTYSIQRFIQTTYGTLVDTKLIYNIGYRARTKLGLDEIEKLYQQKKVYT